MIMSTTNVLHFSALAIDIEKEWPAYHSLRFSTVPIFTNVRQADLTVSVVSPAVDITVRRQGEGMPEPSDNLLDSARKAFRLAEESHGLDGEFCTVPIASFPFALAGASLCAA